MAGWTCDSCHGQQSHSENTAAVCDCTGWCWPGGWNPGPQAAPAVNTLTEVWALSETLHAFSLQSCEGQRSLCFHRPLSNGGGGNSTFRNELEKSNVNRNCKWPLLGLCPCIETQQTRLNQNGVTHARCHTMEMKTVWKQVDHPTLDQLLLQTGDCSPPQCSS